MIRVRRKPPMPWAEQSIGIIQDWSGGRGLAGQVLWVNRELVSECLLLFGQIRGHNGCGLLTSCGAYDRMAAV
mgnify:FL=1